MSEIIGAILILLVGAGGIVGLTAIARRPIPKQTFNEPEAMMEVFQVAMSTIRESQEQAK